MIRQSQLPAAAAARRSQGGFSIPELIVALVMTTMFSALILFFTIQFWSGLGSLQNSSETFVSRLTAGDIMRENLNESSGMLIQNSLSDSHAMAPDPAIASNDFWLPLHAVPGNVANGASGTYTPVAYFRRPSVDTSKTIIMNGLQPYEDEFVLYLDGTTRKLMLRTLANSLAASNRLKTSCPSSAASVTCPADRTVAENVASVDLRFFSRSGNLINHQSITDPLTGDYIGPDYPAVEVIEFNLRITRKSVIKGGKDTSNQTVIRVALRNS